MPLAAALVTLPALATAGTLVERDAMGRRTGTVETRPDGGAVLRDAQGRRTGTVERSGDRWIRRDAQGRRVGTQERAR
jgi:YD repeat-containing protein